MSNVFEFPVQPHESSAFMICPCDQDRPAPFAVCCTQEASPKVLYLKCPACDQEIPVTDGYLDGETTH